MAQRERIGLVGVGNMGGPMARCLAKAAFPVMLFDTKKEATEPFRGETNLFSVAPDLPTLGAECRTVITMLPDSKIVRAATFGADGRGGFGSRLAKGSVVIDMSSSYPIDTQKLGEELEKKGIALVDAQCRAACQKRSPGSSRSWPAARPPTSTGSRARSRPWAPCTEPGYSARATP